MATPDCDVCDYMATIAPSCGFLAFRAGLARLSVDTLKAACAHRIGSSSVVGLQVRDQFIDLLWESCLAAREPIVATAKAKKVNGTTLQLSEPSFKKKKTDNGPVDVTVTMGEIQVMPTPLENEATHTVIVNLENDVAQLQTDNKKIAEKYQQLVDKQEQLALKYAQLEELVKRLQSQQNVCDRLVCTVYDRQRSDDKET